MIAVPLPLWMYYSFLSVSAGLFYITSHLVLNVFGLAVVQPVSKNTFTRLGYINSLNTLCLAKFLLLEGTPFAFKNPIYIDPPSSFGFI